MKLPAELRLHIYHMALVRAFPISLHADRAPEKPDEDVPQPPRPSIPLPTSLEDMSPSPLVAIPSRRTPRANPDKHEYCEPRARPDDPVVPEILRLNKQIYKEARQLLYAENVFTLTLASGVYTLSTLHQRSRSLIKHVVLTIPSHHDILDGFADLVRLGLRYCWGLKSFKIILQASLPDDGRISGATSVYANAFHILRWLPRGCSVLLEGCVSETVRKVVVEEGRLMNVLDEVSVLSRQLWGE
jgi:epsin